MRSIEERLQALNRMIRQIELELNILKTSAYSQPEIYTGVGSNKDLRNRNNLWDSNPDIKLDKSLTTYYRHNELATANRDEEHLYNAAKGKDMEYTPSPLTIRETQILNGVASGKTNRQISLILDVTEQTVKNHLHNILTKLAANDRAHAVFLAIRHGWISLETEREEMVAVA